MTNHELVIQRGTQFPLDGVLERYLTDENVSRLVAQEHERELKRFLILCALNPDAKYAMKGPIDKLWHTFLLFTQEYHAFCKEVAGRFIHHLPESKVGANTESQSRYTEFLLAYEHVFGEPAPTHLWPRNCHESGALNCSGCNGCRGCSDGGDE